MASKSFLNTDELCPLNVRLVGVAEFIIRANKSLLINFVILNYY